MPSPTEFIQDQRFFQKFRSVDIESIPCIFRYAEDCAKVFNSFEESTIQIRSFSIYTFVAASPKENRDTILESTVLETTPTSSVSVKSNFGADFHHLSQPVESAEVGTIVACLCGRKKGKGS